MQTLHPPGWPRPRGYANGISADGRLVFVAGQIGWNEKENMVGPDLTSQFRRVLENTLAVLAAGGAGPGHVARMTWYITSRTEYLANMKEIGTIYRNLMGNHYPAMTMVEVKSLIEARAKVEVETTAVVPYDA
jgi:enamine deaminase RidA (YjgF/YER057c/UK114 family)